MEMAETAGLAFGVLGAFNNTIQCFDYVHLAKHSSRDTQTAILQLDIAKLKLTRWGTSLGLQDVTEETPAFANVSATPEEYKKATSLLQHAQSLFEDAEAESATLKPITGSVDDAVDEVGTDDEATNAISKRLKALSLKNWKPKSVAKRAQWALYTSKHFTRLVSAIDWEVDKIVELFPATKPTQVALCEEEGRALAQEKEIGALAATIKELDEGLTKAIEQALKDKGGKGGDMKVDFSGSHNDGGQQLGFNWGNQVNHFGGSGGKKSGNG